MSREGMTSYGRTTVVVSANGGPTFITVRKQLKGDVYDVWACQQYLHGMKGGARLVSTETLEEALEQKDILGPLVVEAFRAGELYGPIKERMNQPRKVYVLEGFEEERLAKVGISARPDRRCYHFSKVRRASWRVFADSSFLPGIQARDLENSCLAHIGADRLGIVAWCHAVDEVVGWISDAKEQEDKDGPRQLSLF